MVEPLVPATDAMGQFEQERTGEILFESIYLMRDEWSVMRQRPELLRDKIERACERLQARARRTWDRPTAIPGEFV